MAIFNIIFVLILLAKNTISIENRPLSSMVNHAFSCDCFHTNKVSTNGPLLRGQNSINIEEKPIYVIHGARNQFMNQYNRAKIDEFLGRQSSTIFNNNNFMDWLNTQKNIQFPNGINGNGYKNEDIFLRDEPTNESTDVEEESINISKSFSFNNGLISSKIKQFTDIVNFLDKFGCRCAGNFGAIFKAKKYLRISIAHV
ncbi:Hypothetical protein SRAE_X000046700 [Strongyloides ratti]|uniref:Uncharacterized protein n=1 Tax=Strongyloides ratti TaxID=34506 RepID=A0A090LMS5_STRRB|nr:Hypothetical protein SRAE_X000046700 [Strongyloides ratti]CEF71140.1 Hypothetical protein SRAE_X000046700 [Strongyloides ratti]